MSAKRELPHKEQQNFKSAIKHYESKEYKKGLKVCEQILKKVGEHGETLALKGLFLGHLDSKEEAHVSIKKGLKLDLTSPICWHVYGLLHRHEKNYEEACKCYSQSLRIEKNNLQILRDLSVLQVQLGNYEGFNDTCAKLLDARPVKSNWLAYAVSFELLGRFHSAIKVLSTFEQESVGEKTPLAGYEDSEFYLYWNHLIEKSGDYQKALEHLEVIRLKVKDKRSFKEAKARLLLKLKQHAKAELEYTKLLDDNADNASYLQGLEQSRQLDGELTPEKREKLLRMYAKLAEKYKQSHIVLTKPLYYSAVGQFKDLLYAFLVKMLRKGVPSLFNSVKGLLTDTEKAAIVEETIVEIYNKLLDNQSLADDEKEFPNTYLWTTFFMAQLYDYHGNTLKALEFIDVAIGHSPTVVELYMFKARIYKHAGDYESSMQQMDYARRLDLQDRFVNSKCTKYMLRNNNVEDAEQTIALFAKDNSPVDPNQDLIDMQCVWYAYATACAHQRSARFGLALKRYNQIDKHFNDYIDDQIDFHTYGMRKQTLRSYVELVEQFGSIREHRFFVKAAKGAVETYLTLYEGGPVAEQMIDGVSLLGMSEADRKKLAKKAKKADLKKVDGDKPEKKDTDNFGTQFVAGVDHLAQATKFLSPLLGLKSDLSVLELACRLYLHKKKYLLVLQKLIQAKSVDPNAPFISYFTFQLSRVLGDLSVDPQVLEILKSKLKEVFGVDDTTPFLSAAQQILESDSSTLQAILYASRIVKALDSDFGLPPSLSSTDTIARFQLNECADALQVVKSVFGDDALTTFKDACKQVYPMAKDFQ